MGIEEFPKLDKNSLHDLAIQYLKLKYNDTLPTLEMYFDDYLNTVSKLDSRHSELLSKFNNDSVMNR